jgi:replicative DNA helicase
MNNIAKVPPQNLEAELSVLGGILLDDEAINKVNEIIKPSDFYRSTHAKIFTVMNEIFDKGDPIDLITLHAALKTKGLIDEVGGPAYIATLADGVPTAANIKHYAEIVKDMSTRRKYIDIAMQIVTQGYQEDGSDIKDFISFAEEGLSNITDQNKSNYFSHVKSLTKDSFKTIETLFNSKSTLTGTPSGFAELDYMTSGFQKTDLIIIAGRPSMGKTAFSLNLAINALRDEETQPVALFSLEMSKEQLVLRILCSESKIDASLLRRGLLGESAWPKLTRAAGALCESDLYIDDTPGISVPEMRSKARRLKQEKGLGMIIVDYLQLMRGRDGRKSREQEISEISRSLKGLAKELKVPVIALSQLSRSVEQRGGDRRPMLSDLRESGSIEQDADVVMFVYREEVYNKEDDDIKGIAEIILGKQRNGPIGTVKLAWVDTCTRFENLTEEYEGHWQD